jgi:oligopeptide transport system substrate-binding protein
VNARFLFTAIALLAAAACSRRTTPVDTGNLAGILHVGNGAEVQSLDPHIAGGTVDQNVLSALFEGLVTLDEETFQPRPGAAERWEISSDGLVYTFHLRRGGRWSNGDPLTARDFLFSFRRVLSPALASEYKDVLFPIKNAAAYAGGRLADFAQVGCRAPDDYTVELTLARPTAYFMAVLRTNVAFPVHAASVTRGGSRPDDRTARWTRVAPFVGNGAFRLREWKDHQHVATEKNPHYWDAARVRLNGVRFYPSESTRSQELAFRAGQLHTTWDVPLSKLDAYRATQPSVLRMEPYFESYFFRFNVTRPPFTDVRVRRALALAIDRDAIAKSVLRGGQTPATALTPPGFAGYTPLTGIAHDPAAARRLLAEAGFPDGRGFPSFELVTLSSELNQRIAEAVQQMWRQELGLNATISQKEFKVLLQVVDNAVLDYAVARGRWIAEYPDPLTYLAIFTSGSGINCTGYADSEYDAQLAAAAAVVDPAARLAALHRAEQRLLAQMPIAPVYWGTRTTLVAPSVRGWKNSALGFHNYQDVWLEP